MTAETSYPQAEQPFNIGPWRTAYAEKTGVVGSANGLDRGVYVNSSGMNVFRRAGARWIQGIYATHDEDKQLTVPDNAAGSARVDRVVDRLLADGTITTELKTGTAGTGSPPALTQTAGGTWEESLGYFTVPSGATNLTVLGNPVTDERRFLGRTITPVSSDAMLPATSFVGDLADYPDGSKKRWNGTAWILEGATFWTGSDNSGVVLAPNNNGTGVSSYSVTTPAAGTALLTVTANVSGSGMWQALIGLRIDGVDRFAAMTLMAGPGAVFHGSAVVPLSAGAHAMVPRYVTGTGGGLLTFVSASFTLLMGQAL